MMLKTYGSLFGERFGTRAPQILALHGWGRDRSDFRVVLEGHDAVAVDLPGFGASPAPGSAMGASGYADSLTPVLDDFADPPVVIGHSFGGRVAVNLAAAEARQIRGLVLVGVPLLHRIGTPPRPSLRFRTWRYLHSRGLTSDERMEAVRRRGGSADYRAARGVMREVLVRVLAESYEDQLRRLECPVELIWGSDDPEVPVEVAQRALGLVPQGNLTVVPGAGHLLPLEAPDDIRALAEKLI